MLTDNCEQFEELTNKSLNMSNSDLLQSHIESCNICSKDNEKKELIFALAKINSLEKVKTSKNFVFNLEKRIEKEKSFFNSFNIFKLNRFALAFSFILLFSIFSVTTFIQNKEKTRIAYSKGITDYMKNKMVIEHSDFIKNTNIRGYDITTPNLYD